MRLPYQFSGTSVFYLQQAVLLLRAFRRRCYHIQECRMLFQLIFFQLKLHCKELKTKQSKTCSKRLARVYLSEWVSAVRTAVLKLWNFTLDFTFLLSEIFLCSCPQRKQKIVPGLKLERQLSLYSLLWLVLLKIILLWTLSHQPFPVNTVKCFRIRPIRITESCIFILFFTRPIIIV